MQRYRANASVGDLKHGELVEIDATHPHWQGLIAAGYLTQVEDESARPARLAVPDIVSDPQSSTAPVAAPSDDTDEVARVRRAIVAHPDETNGQIAERTDSTRRLVGKVRRGEA